ncbi:MAG: hypothetical protein ACRETT_08745, partial [Steroidobacteraceae bacterium]
VALAFALLAGMAFASQSQATVLRVVVVQTDNASGYVKEIERGKAILKRLGSSAVLRIWRARFAGEDTGTVVVSVEYPSLAVLAQDEAKAVADPEYSTWLSGLDRLRKIVSDSTYDELKP